MKGEITLKYDEEKTAETIAKAVSPDNLVRSTLLCIVTNWKENKVVTNMKCASLKTFIATIDDLLFCISTAEKTIQAIKP